MALVSIPYTFTNGTTADATQVNANFTAIFGAVNGNLDSANISSLNAAKINAGSFASGAYSFPGSLSIGTPLPVTSGGTGTATPGLVAGTNVTITGSWPNQTINASGGGGGTVTAVTASSPLSSSGGTTPNITITSPLPVTSGGTGTATPGLVAGTNVTITGSWPNQTINASGGGGGTVTAVTASSPLSSSGGTTPNITITSPLPVANGGTGKTSALTVKLAIAMGFQSGAVSTSTQFPVQPVVAYTGGTITGIRAAAGTADNGTTVFAIFKNGSSVATITLSTSIVSTASASFTIAAGDYLTMTCTTAGTAQNVGVVLEGTQQAS